MKTKPTSPFNAILTLCLITFSFFETNAQWTIYNTTNSGLPVNGVSAIAIDANGNRWIGTSELGNPATNAGLSKFAVNGSWTTWNGQNSGWSGTSCNSMAIDSLGNVWCGNAAGINKLSGNTVTFSSLEGNAFIQQLAIDKKGYIWAPSHAGLFRIKRSSSSFSYTLYNSTSAPAMGGAKMNAVAIDNIGNIWAGGWDSGVRKFDGNSTWTQYNSTNSAIPGDYTNTMGRDSSGNIWVTSQGTILSSSTTPYVGKYDGNSWTIYKHISKGGPMPSAKIYSMAFDKANDVVWFGSADSGLIRFDGTKWKAYKSSNTPGLPSNNIAAVAVDKDGSLWVGSAGVLAHWTCTAPTITASSNISMCSGASTTLTVSGAADSYKWSPATGLNVTNGTSVIASPSATTTYTVTGNNLPGCASIKTITVTITPSPVVANAGSDVSVCAGSGLTLSASGGTTYSWSPATGLSSTTIANPVANPASSTTYTVIVKDAKGCSNSDQVMVTVKPGPVANAGTDVSICPGFSATLAASGGTTYSWSPATGLSATNIANPIASPVTTTIYTVTASVVGFNGCTGNGTDQVLVTIKPKPAANAGYGGAICNGDLFPLQASGGGTYSWSPATGLSSTSTSNPNASPANDITYTVTVTGTNGCSANSTVSITVYQGPPIPVITKSGNVLTSSSTDVLVYEWYKNGNIIPGANNQSYTMTGSGSYHVVVTNADGCSSTSAPFIMTGVNELLSLHVVNSYFDADSREIVMKFYSAEKDQYVIELYNIVGQQVVKTRMADHSGEFSEHIPAADLGKGIYMLSITSDKMGLVAYKKIAVE